MNIDKRIIDFFEEQKIYNEKFFKFMDNKIVLLPSDSDIFWYGCHPIIKENIIKDIRLVVPEIKTEKDLLINIHEFTHAIELYNELETPYEDRREKREQKAKTMEKTYLNQKM